MSNDNFRSIESTPNDSLSKQKSKVWLFCEKTEDEAGTRARCKICGMVICFSRLCSCVHEKTKEFASVVRDENASTVKGCRN